MGIVYWQISIFFHHARADVSVSIFTELFVAVARCFIPMLSLLILQSIHDCMITVLFAQLFWQHCIIIIVSYKFVCSHSHCYSSYTPIYIYICPHSFTRMYMYVWKYCVYILRISYNWRKRRVWSYRIAFMRQMRALHKLFTLLCHIYAVGM